MTPSQTAPRPGAAWCQALCRGFMALALQAFCVPQLLAWTVTSRKPVADCEAVLSGGAPGGVGVSVPHGPSGRDG